MLKATRSTDIDKLSDLREITHSRCSNTLVILHTGWHSIELAQPDTSHLGEFQVRALTTYEPNRGK